MIPDIWNKINAYSQEVNLFSRKYKKYKKFIFILLESKSKGYANLAVKSRPRKKKKKSKKYQLVLN